MFSKNYLRYFGAVTLVLSTLTSCTPKLGEAPPDINQQKLDGTQCLSNLKPVVTRYLAGEATNGEVAEGWDCAAVAIRKFKQYVYGRSDDRFTSEELVEFLEKNFLAPTGPKISADLRLQFMKFKQLLVGGSAEALTRVELDQIIDLFGEMKSVTVRINPYMAVISQKWSDGQTRDSQEDAKFFEKANDEIQGAAGELADLIVKNNKSYNLDDFVTFMKEYADFYGAHWTVPAQIEKYMPVVKKIKRAIAGGSADIIQPSEWKSFILLGVRGYTQYLRYYYFIKSASATGSGIRLTYVSRTLEDIFGAFHDLLLVKPADPSCGTALDRGGKKANLSCITKAEISDILIAFSGVFHEFKVSPKLIDEAMKLKKVYFGGSDTGITSVDFERGKNKTAGLNAAVEKFLPYYSIYTLAWDRSGYDFDQAQAYFKEAQDNLVASAADLGALFEDSYNLDNLVTLLNEVDVLYPNKDPKVKYAAMVGKYLPLVKDTKNIVFSEKDTLVKKTQWSPFLNFGSRFYSTFLHYNYFIENENYGSPAFFESFKKISDQILDVGNDIVKAKKSQSLSADEVALVMKRLVEIGVLPSEISASSIDQLVKILLNRIMWPAELRVKSSVPNVINATSFANVRNEIQIWYESERYGFSLSANPLTPADLQRTLAAKLKDPKITPALKIGVTEMAMLAAGPVPQTVDADGQQVISHFAKQIYGPLSLTRLNAKRSIARLLIRGGITNRSRLDNYQGVNLEEVKAFFNPIRPFLVEIEFLTPDNMTFADSRFRDANIFVAHGNGDDLVNFQEMGDVVGMIMSGINIGDQMTKDVVSRCLPSHTKVHLTTTISEKCLFGVYLDRIDNYFKSAPEFLKFFRTSDRDDFAVYFVNLLKAAGYAPNDSGLVRMADANLTPHAIQYLEMMIVRFDANKDGIIDLQEAKDTFPAFKGMLMELIKGQSLIKEKDLLAMFLYIMHYGSPPAGVKDYLFKWLPWKSNPDKWTVAADRNRLAGILGYIADQVNAATKKALLSQDDESEIRRSPGYKESSERD